MTSLEKVIWKNTRSKRRVRTDLIHLACSGEAGLPASSHVRRARWATARGPTISDQPSLYVSTSSSYSSSNYRGYQ